MGTAAQSGLSMTITTQKSRIEVDITWMVRSDFEEVMAIENLSFPPPWTIDELLSCLRQTNVRGMTAKHTGCVVGFMVYELLKGTLHVLNFAVHPGFQRRGVGSQMTDKLAVKLSQQRLEKCVLEVRETNLAAQLFFSKQGYLAGDVLRGHYEDSDEDAYQFTYYAEC